MAAIQGYANGFDSSLEDYPPWKKELILRKRANAKQFHGTGITPIPPPSQYSQQQMHISSLQGPAQLALSSSRGPKDSLSSRQGHSVRKSGSTSDQSVTGDFEVGCDGAISGKTPSALNRDNGVINAGVVDENNTKMHHKGLRGQCKSPSELCIEDELEYGPGIVSKLKNRYLTLAQRESRGRASLRRFSSLEDLLDEEEPEWQRGRNTQKTRPTQSGQTPVRKEAMKRARSMDSLALRRMDSNERKFPKSVSASGLRQEANLKSLGRKDIIIIEHQQAPKEESKKDSFVNKSKPKQPVLIEEEEYPPVDKVKQAKQVFETPGGKVLRGTAAKVAMYKASKANKPAPASQKPVIKAKPLELQRKPLSSKPTDVVKSSLKLVNSHGHSVPRSTLPVKAAIPVTSSKPRSPTPQALPTVTGLTPITASVTSPIKEVSAIVLNATQNISPPPLPKTSDNVSPLPSTPEAEDISQFDDLPLLPPAPSLSRKPRAPSPVLTDLPSSPPSSHKVSIPSAFKSERANTKENQRVLHENRKNAEKSSKPFKEVFGNVPLSPPKAFSSKAESPTSPSTHAPKFPIERGSTMDDIKTQISPVKDFSRAVPTSPETVIKLKEQKHAFTPAITARDFETNSMDTGSPPVFARPSPTASSTPIYGQSRDEKLNSVDKMSTPTGVPTGLVPKTSKLKDRRQQQDNSSLVFNFSKREETPDYIENDGVDLSKRKLANTLRHESGYVIMPGYDGNADSSTDDLDDDVHDSYVSDVNRSLPPCDITFIGDAVIINGRSNLQRQPRTKKLEISFDMVSTLTHEYPSELSLLQEMDEIERLQGPLHIQKHISTVEGSTGGLASYTPKLQLSFELGISRTVHPPTPPREKNFFEDELLEHLRPAPESETIAWSQDSAPDLLF